MSIAIYGPRVVGKEEYERQKQVVQTASQIYGPRVIGRGQARRIANGGGKATGPQAGAPGQNAGAEGNGELERLRQENEQLRARMEALEALAKPAGGTNVVADQSAAGPSETPAAVGATDDPGQSAAGADGYLSVAELQKAVQANPALVDRFLADELARQPRPRTSALRALLEAEAGERGGRRPDVIEKIKAALGEIGR